MKEYVQARAASKLPFCLPGFAILSKAAQGAAKSKDLRSIEGAKILRLADAPLGWQGRRGKIEGGCYDPK